jgi:hypothetical protein
MSSCKSRTEKAGAEAACPRSVVHSLARLGSLLAASALVAGLTGCSDIYYDRRETIALGADDHRAADEVLQMIDPWPRYVGNKNLAFNGERMQVTVECYRHNPRVYLPTNPNTTALAQDRAQAAAGTTCPPLTPVPREQPAAPVKY